jgi:hypothetical protein
MKLYVELVNWMKENPEPEVGYTIPYIKENFKTKKSGMAIWNNMMTLVKLGVLSMSKVGNKNYYKMVDADKCVVPKRRTSKEVINEKTSNIRKGVWEGKNIYIIEEFVFRGEKRVEITDESYFTEKKLDVWSIVVPLTDVQEM